MLCFYNMSGRDKQGAVFKALADDRRREILDLLKDGPRTTGELCGHFKRVDRCTVMQHIGVLEVAGLVIAKREGRGAVELFGCALCRRSMTVGLASMPGLRWGCSRG